MKPHPEVKTLKALRDELKLKLHLASMELKSDWERLEPQVERAISSAAIVTGETLADLHKRLEEFKQRLT
ncbi:MAG: hypothetical protein JNM17_08595 [Archangium sp.]|nr:hypothetical protein [Archangium sp.]